MLFVFPLCFSKVFWLWSRFWPHPLSYHKQKGTSFGFQNQEQRVKTKNGTTGQKLLRPIWNKSNNKLVLLWFCSGHLVRGLGRLVGGHGLRGQRGNMSQYWRHTFSLSHGAKTQMKHKDITAELKNHIVENLHCNCRDRIGMRFQSESLLAAVWKHTKHSRKGCVAQAFSRSWACLEKLDLRSSLCGKCLSGKACLQRVYWRGRHPKKAWLESFLSKAGRSRRACLENYSLDGVPISKSFTREASCKMRAALEEHI